MSTYSLGQLLSSLHDDVHSRLTRARATIPHPGAKGDASEEVWLEVLQTYLPHRYQADRAFVVDSKGSTSDQIDVVVFDRQYTPLIFTFQGQTFVPAESVYAVFEVKQTIDAELVRYAQHKVASVRALHRTSLPIPSADRVYPPRTPQWILGGLLTLDSDWSPPLGEPLRGVLAADAELGCLDLGCVAAHGVFLRGGDGGYAIVSKEMAATAFLFEFIAHLQGMATVPMIDIRAYARWLP